MKIKVSVVRASDAILTRHWQDKTIPLWFTQQNLLLQKMPFNVLFNFKEFLAQSSTITSLEICNFLKGIIDFK